MLDGKAEEDCRRTTGGIRRTTYYVLFMFIVFTLALRLQSIVNCD